MFHVWKYKPSKNYINIHPLLQIRILCRNWRTLTVSGLLTMCHVTTKSLAVPHDFRMEQLHVVLWWCGAPLMVYLQWACAKCDRGSGLLCFLKKKKGRWLLVFSSYLPNYIQTKRESSSLHQASLLMIMITIVSKHVTMCWVEWWIKHFILWSYCFMAGFGGIILRFDFIFYNLVFFLIWYRRTFYNILL